MQFQLKPLIAALLIAGASNAFAMVELSDDVLSTATAQDGLSIEASATPAGTAATDYAVKIDSVQWKDNVVNGMDVADTNSYTMQFNNIGLSGINQADSVKMRVTTEAGAQSATDPAIKLHVATAPYKLSADALQFCTGVAVNCTTGNSLGKFMLVNNRTTTLTYTGVNGFSSNSRGSIRVLLYNFDFRLEQNGNQLVFGDIAVDFSGVGKTYVNPISGLIMEGDTVLKSRSPITGKSGDAVGSINQAGLQFSLMAEPGTIASSTFTNNLGGASQAKLGIMRLGFYGMWKDAKLNIRGMSEADFTAGGTDTTVLGGNVASGKSLVGGSGVAIQLSGTVGQDPDDATNKTAFSIGEAGTDGYGLKAYDDTSFANSGLAWNANNLGGTFDFGRLYLNLTKYPDMKLPENTILSAPASGATPQQVATTAEFTQKSAGTATGLLWQMRGVTFDHAPHHTEMVHNTNNLAASTATEWSLVPLFNNMNVNLKMYPKASSIGFDYMISTEGQNTIGDKTTTLGLLDSGTNQMIGFTDINFLSKGYGDFTINSANPSATNEAEKPFNLKLSLTKFLMAVDMNFGAPFMPQATSGGRTFSLADFHNRTLSSLFKIRMRLETGNATAGAGTGGSTTYYLYPNNSNIGLGAVLDFGTNKNSSPATETANNSFIHLVDSQNTTFALNKITGKLSLLNGYIDFTRNGAEDNIIINAKLKPENLQTTLGMYPNTTAFQRFGELRIDGGSITTNLVLTPRNR